ncbi:hemagglutinin repeat-containing protein [Erwinia sp. QL-Z3]|uniref:hemagglutinin repeat-containing protein n=1 Tax=Erwinia sp. QL-Z3 TaxID=2547962 RepID=UPI001070B25A|nr:hemagglutinin repeat-containing protein [Erwinia sp. QL-Z3]QBR49030.1 filamentous hemagglutinin N-terminal domain-containing protein [Erwinia sp. QL-Z3]
MNKNLFRIVFNKARGMLMVVADIAASGRSSSSPSSGLGQTLRRRVSVLSPLQFALLLALGCVTLSTQAGVVADRSAPGSQQATIINAANGTPQINIQTPSAGGVSRNVYSQFDVNKHGVVLNNSHANTQSQLAGMVTGNPWLARGEASVILNEVNSRNPSLLNGYVEVAGKKAQVVIANPSGITCDGCGFINANRATLTTGQPQMKNGLIAGYEVDKGQIVVKGAGLDSGLQDSTDLIARAVSVNAGIWASDLKVTAGRNRVGAQHNEVTAKAADGSVSPVVAIDVAALGGMYASKIRLLGTEKGVGVHNAGNIGASAGDVVVNADGSITNRGTLNAAENLRLASQGGVANSGKMYAAVNTDVQSAGLLSNSGSVAAGKQTTLNAAAIRSDADGALGAGINSDGSKAAAGDLALNSRGELTVNGKAVAAGRLTAKGTTVNFSGSQTHGSEIVLQASAGDISTASATLEATHGLTATATGGLNNSGGKVSADTLTLIARSLNNQQGLLQQLGQSDLTLSFADGIDNTQGTLGANAKNLTLNGASFTNQQGSLLHLGDGELSIATGEMNGSAGSLRTQGSLSLNSGRLVLDNAITQAGSLTVTATALSHRQGTMRQTGSGPLTVTVEGALDNQGGSIASGGHLNLSAGSLTNHSGKLSVVGEFTLLSDGLDNQQGVIAAGAALSVNSNGLNNDGGLLQSDGAMTLDTGAGALSNRDSGSNGGILSRSTLVLRAGDIDNAAGFIGAADDATLTGLSLSNQDGTLASDAGLTLTSNAMNNQRGVVQAGTALSLNTRGNTLKNGSGLFTAGQTLTLLTGALLNGAGQLISSGALSLNTEGQQLDNGSGVIAATGDAQLLTGALNNAGGQLQVVGNALIATAGADLDNTAGLIRSGKSLALSSGRLTNRHTQSDHTGIEGQSVTLNSATVDNSAGAVRASELLALNTGSTLNNSSGLLSSGGTLAVNGANTLTLTNTGGTLIAGNALNLSADALGGDGRVLSQNAMTLVLQQAFFNQGQVIANGDMTFNLGGGGLVNQSLIQAGGTLTLNAGSLNNRQSAEISAGENHLLISGNVTNRGLLDGGLTHIVSASLNNIGSGRLYGDHIALQTGTLTNQAENGTAATIAARDRLDIGVQTLNNRDHGLIYSGGDLAIGGLLNGSWKATGQASVFNNHSAMLESAGNMALDIGQIDNINDNLVTDTVVVEQSSHHEAVLSGAITRYDWADIDTSNSNQYGVRQAIMPDGSSGGTFYEYQYDRTITETQVTESDPGQIIAGGNLTINSSQVNNHDSRIVAGGLLGGAIGELNNIATTGERVITDTGTQTRWYAKKTRQPLGPTKTSQGKDSSEYDPEPVVQTIDLLTLAWQGNEPVNGSGTSTASRQPAGITVTVVDPGAVSAPAGQTPVTLPPGQIMEIVQPGSDNSTIRAIAPDTKLPDNSLFQLHPDSNVGYLVETDPRFTNQKQWLGSDYMQNQFTQDPNNVLRRLGDGYYEQQLIRRQVIALTGNRYLNGYSNDEAQYRALMDAGVLFGKTYSLTPGVALSAQQMALLTSDMVWLVTQTVSLPDGSTQQVLVPQLYARVKPGDLDGSGALLSGNDVSLAVSNDLTNSGHITGRTVTQLTADNLNNSGFIGGDKVDLRARTDINNIGGTLQGGSNLTAIAGRDLNSISTLGGSTGNITFDRPAGIYVQGENGTLGLQAMNDINLTAAQISNAGAGSQTQIIAGHDLNLNTLTTTGSESGDWGGGNSRSLTQSTEVGSQINGGGDVSLLAGNDLNARAAAVTAQDSLSAVAGNDLNLTSSNATYHLTEDSHQSSGGLLSRKSVTTHDEVQSQTAIGSSFSGDSVSLQAGRDLTLSGSNVVGTNDVALSAGRDLTLTTAEEMRQENHQYKETKSGLSGTGGIGFTAGSSSLKVTDDALSHSSAGSTVGSTNGNVSLTAGNTLTVKGSDLLAAQDLTLSGSEVNILAAENQSTQKHTVEQKQSGLTLALSGVVGSAINSAVTMATDAGSETSGRLAVLKGMQAALTGVQAYQGASLAEAGGSAGSLVGVNLSYGSQSSKSEQTMTQNQHQGSQLTAGNNLSITASKTDINIQGSKLQAGGDASLSAARDLNLISSQDSQKLEGKNKSQGASVGVGINFGQGANGLSLNASVNAGRGSESGNGTTHNETTVSAGNNLNIVSGRDTTLTGAQVSGEKVALEVGRNLTMTSEQDSDNYDSKQQNASAGGSVSMGGGSGTVSLSQDKMHSTWRSVQEQTGIFAGSGGFDVTVGEHTQLNGAVMDSSADADKNRLDTGTLGWSDIKNEAEYKVQHQSVGVSSGGSMGTQFAGNAANNLLTGANRSGSDSSTTKSAVSEGTIVIRDPQGQQQSVADISRDTKNANAGLGKIFDKEKEQQRLKEAQLIGQIGAQVGDIARTQGQIAGERAKNDPAALEAARDKLAASGKPYTDEDVAKQAYNTAMAPYGTGSSLQQGIGAATAAIQGLAGGNIAQAVSGAASPYLAEQIHNMTTDASGKVNTEANLMAHAVLGAVVAQAQGNSALAGAAGATTGEYIAQQLYPGIDRKDLTEEQRQTISALGTLAAGLAGGIVGDSTGNAVANAQAGKNSSENNNLSLPGCLGSYGQAAASLGSSMIDAGATTEVINTALIENAKGDLPEGANITKAIVEGYKDGVLIAGSAYLGPAASIGKVVAGATIAEIANGTYQWFDLSQPGNENNSWDYWGSASAAVTGALAPGRDIWKNVGIAAAGSVFTDGPDALAVGSSAAGAWAGGIFGQYMPGVVNSVTGKDAPGFIFDTIGSLGTEFLGGYSRDLFIRANPQNTSEKEKEVSK